MDNITDLINKNFAEGKTYLENNNFDFVNKILDFGKIYLSNLYNFAYNIIICIIIYINSITNDTNAAFSIKLFFFLFLIVLSIILLTGITKIFIKLDKEIDKKLLKYIVEQTDSKDK